jgi:hypothetical protein
MGESVPAPNAPGPDNANNLDSPLLPSQALNSSPLYSSPSAYGNAGNASSQLSAPEFYNTGAFDLSQVVANNAIAQAFMMSGTISSEQGPDAGPSPLDRIRIGPVDIKTAINLGIVADDNINGQPSGPNRLHDVDLTLTPAILIVYGAHDGQKAYASLVYAPTLTRYAHYSAQDSDDQNVSLNLQYPFQRLSLNATETYAQTSGVNQDAHARTTQTSEIASVGANYLINDKLSAQTSVDYLNSTYSGNASGAGTTSSSNNRDGVGLNGDTHEAWNGTLGYQFTDKLTFGPGFSVGIESPQNSARQNFEQALVNVNYRPTGKFGFFGQGGVEWRQYSGAGNGSQTNPIFSGGVNYTPTETTSFSLSAYQNVEPTTDTSNQTDVNTGVQVTASERFFQRVNLSFNFTYAHTAYSSDGGSSAPIRVGATTPYTINANGSSQDTFAFRPSLNFAINQWTAVALYYQYLGNDSSTQGYGYYDNSLGFSLTAQF